MAATAALTFGGLPAGMATANLKTIQDGRDVKRDSVDIESASADHRGRLLVHTVDAYDSFSTKKAPCVLLRFDAVGHGYEVCGNGRLRPRFVDQQPGAGRVEVERPAPDQVAYMIPLRKIGNPERYWWQAYTGCGCDFAPNNRGVKHTL